MVSKIGTAVLQHTLTRLGSSLLLRENLPRDLDQEGRRRKTRESCGGQVAQSDILLSHSRRAMVQKAKDYRYRNKDTIS